MLKEKLKSMKRALKDWHLTHFHNFSCRMDYIKAHISDLDK